MEVLYEDKDLIVVIKPAGVASQSVTGFEEDMVSLIKKHLPGDGPEPYVGVVHRLDKPVSGVMVYAKNKESAAALSKQLNEGGFNKTYQAIVNGILKEKKGEMRDYLIKDDKENISKVAVNIKNPGDLKNSKAKEAVLKYKVLDSKFINGKQKSKVEIELLTGRHHQIRVQFASRNNPVEGDKKYGLGEDVPLALAAVSLRFIHPRTRKEMVFKYDWNRNIS